MWAKNVWAGGVWASNVWAENREIILENWIEVSELSTNFNQITELFNFTKKGA